MVVILPGGETREKRSYTEDNSVTYEKDFDDIAGDSRYDAATANWGGTWRLPTKAEIDELWDNCAWERTTQGGYEGFRVTSKKNGNSIFLPVAGGRYGALLYYAEMVGYYWSSTPYDDESNTKDAYYLNFDSVYRFRGWSTRYEGFPVRPVTE